MTTLFISTSLAFVLTLLGTFLVKQFARELRLVNEPNNRDMHTNVTPHGGGLGIVIGFSLVSLWLIWQEDVHQATLWSVIGLFLLIAIIGLIDDMFHLSAAIRLLVHTIVCFVLYLGVASLPVPQIPDILILPFWLTVALVVLAGSWWINLFNFMDGIDGIAASQAIFMLVAVAGITAYFQPHVMGTTVWVWMLTLAAATAGFLALNWAPAQIFMGDVGSTFLAFMILFFALISVSLGWINYASWVILGAVFVTDATLTLSRRLISGQNIFQAHRSHVFQQLARKWQSHAKTTLAIWAVNLFWLLPLAVMCSISPWNSWWWVLIAYTPLILLAYLLGAGKIND
jgi:Fuc2NAc and GlcNAc transferase